MGKALKRNEEGKRAHPFLPFRNHLVFRRVMRDPETAKEFLERILHMEIERIEYCNTEQVLDLDLESKSVRLDLYVKDPERVFDVEIQCQNYSDIGKRMAYYQASINSEAIERGRKDFELPESFIIFLCVDDPFGYGCPLYTFEMRCVEAEGLALETGSSWLALNAQDYESEEDEKIRNVLRYVRNEEVALGDSLIERIDSEVHAINRDGEWVHMASMFMTMEEHARALGRLSGKKEGRAEGEARLAKLIEALIGSGRSDELERVAADPVYRESLFKEFGIA